MSVDMNPLDGPTKREIFFEDRIEAEKDGNWYVREIVDMRCPVCHMRTTVAITGPDRIHYAHVVDNVTRWHVVRTAVWTDNLRLWRFLFEIGEDAP